MDEDFVVNIMVNDVTCNDIVYSISIMTLSFFLQKAYCVKTGWYYIVSYICYITFIESDCFLWVKKPTK